MKKTNNFERLTASPERLSHALAGANYNGALHLIECLESELDTMDNIFEEKQYRYLSMLLEMERLKCRAVHTVWERECLAYLNSEEENFP